MDFIAISNYYTEKHKKCAYISVFSAGAGSGAGAAAGLA